ncbi:sulfurtransferase TusA family protein [Ectothiorhodospira lacustris]|uniref:sulfurtransferase TusA family protein n=1 Tax=Ectothiorhodospira lacustris TaxID=2899127 RepID=UPI001EE9A6CD|nr:sulfurtransferase TusA family protein [Ectothiorhodospira lacustris]MCG5501324.1 sulfurtransferase TusA family protein [Ectothiorhodospira lacustris]
MAIKLRDTVIFEKKNETDYLLDVRGYGCPHVQVYAEKALKKISHNDTLTIIFDNPSSGESIRYMCSAGGHDLTDQRENEGTFTWTIRKS